MPKCLLVNRSRLLRTSQVPDSRGCPIVGGASQSQHVSLDASGGEFPADAEIDEDDLVFFLVIEYVLRFDIAVAYFVRVYVVECL